MFNELVAIMKISIIFIPIMLIEYIIIKTMNALSYPFSSLFNMVIVFSLPLTGLIFLYLLYDSLFNVRGYYQE